MITYIRWRDATYQDRQYRVCDMLERLQLSETVGMFVRETSSMVTVALDCFPSELPGEETEYRHIMHIPKSCIERRIDFDVPREIENVSLGCVPSLLHPAVRHGKESDDGLESDSGS